MASRHLQAYNLLDIAIWSELDVHADHEHVPDDCDAEMNQYGKQHLQAYLMLIIAIWSELDVHSDHEHVPLPGDCDAEMNQNGKQTLASLPDTNYCDME